MSNVPFRKMFRTECLLFPGKSFNRIERGSCVDNRMVIVSRRVLKELKDDPLSRTEYLLCPGEF